MFVDFNILNQLGSPSINSNTFANRPAAGQTGRLFVSTDTFEIFRDNGTGWDLIGGPGAGTITGTGTATQVAYFSGAQTIGSSANLFWDNTNSFLGVGTSAPTAGVHVVDTDAFGMYSQITTVAGTTATSVGLYAKNTTNFFGYAAIFDENTPNSASGQYPILIRHSLSSGTAAANMATGIHFGLPDDAGTERINQFSMDTTDPAAATYSSRYRFLLRNNGSAVTPFYITGTGIGVFTATPGAALDIHSTGIMAQLNSTSATANSLLAFQRSGNGLWRIGDAYNGGNNYFELHNTVLTNNAIEVTAANNKSTFTALETYASGLATGNQFTYNLTVPNGVNITQPNAVGAVNSYLNLSLGGNTTVSVGARQGLEGNSRISFTGAGTLTIAQGSTVRAFSALSSVYSFNGTAAGTVTHLAGLRICFPDNIGSAINITNNYGLLLNDQTTGTGTVTYTNRWGIYQEGASDLNYLNGNLLIKSTTNTGEALQVTGTAKVTSTLTANSLVKSGGTASQILAADGSVITAGTNITIAAGQISSTGGGISGSGTTNYLPKFTAATTLGDSRFFDNGSVTFLGNGDVNATPSTGIFSGTGGTGTNIAGAELRIRGGASTGNAAGGPITFYTSAAGSAGTGVNAATERMRIDALGNLGLGVTPSAWRSTDKVLQINNFSLYDENGTNLWLGLNFYENTSGSYIYTNNGFATAYRQQTGQHNWFSAPSGTAGNVISFTQTMTLNASGNLGIGTTTIGSRLQVNGNAAIGYSASTAAPTNGLAVAGNVGFGTTSPVTVLQIESANAAALPATSGTTQSTGHRIRMGTTIGTGILDIGTNGGGGMWLQSTDRASLSTNYALLLNPNGGSVGIGTSSPTGRLHIDPADNEIGINVSTSSLTGANAQSLLDLSQTWNTTGNPAAIKLNITNTASGATAYLMDLQVGAATQFRVTKAGAIRTAAPTTGTANDWKLGTRVAAVVALDTTQYIELEVGGTLYKLAIVT